MKNSLYILLIVGLLSCGESDSVKVEPEGSCCSTVETKIASNVAEKKSKSKSHQAEAGLVSYDFYQDGGKLYVLQAMFLAESHQYQLLLQKSGDGGASWGEKILIPVGKDAPRSPHHGNDVQLAVSGEKIIVIWQIKGKGYMGSGPMRTAYSADGGNNWTLSEKSPADTGSSGGESFVDVCADNQGNFHLCWLDSRNKKRGLRYTVSSDGGKTWAKNSTVDELTCQCCWNTIKADGDKVYILYRNEAPRDLSLASLNQGKWNLSGSVGGFNWDFNGCPHVGGSLNFDSEKTPHCTVWSGKEDGGGLYYFHQDSFGNFANKHKLGGDSAKHSSLVVGSQGQVLLAWSEIVNGVSVVMVQLSKDGGLTWKSARQLSLDLAGQHPRAIATARGFRVFWSEQRDGKHSLASALVEAK